MQSAIRRFALSCLFLKKTLDAQMLEHLAVFSNAELSGPTFSTYRKEKAQFGNTVGCVHHFGTKGHSY